MRAWLRRLWRRDPCCWDVLTSIVLTDGSSYACQEPPGHKQPHRWAGGTSFVEWTRRPDGGVTMSGLW